jgi:hypothetical protein
MPATQVDAMRSAGPAERHYDPESRPVMDLLRRVLKLRNVAELSVVKPDFRLELRGHSNSTGAAPGREDSAAPSAARVASGALSP